MSIEDLLKCSDADLDRFAAEAGHEELRTLFDSIWLRIRSIGLTGQPRTVEAAETLVVAKAALRIAEHVGNEKLSIDAQHMTGRSLSANEEFEKAIPYYRNAIAGLDKLGEYQ